LLGLRNSKCTLGAASVRLALGRGSCIFSYVFSSFSLARVALKASTCGEGEKVKGER